MLQVKRTHAACCHSKISKLRLAVKLFTIQSSDLLSQLKLSCHLNVYS